MSEHCPVVGRAVTLASTASGVAGYLWRDAAGLLRPGAISGRSQHHPRRCHPFRRAVRHRIAALPALCRLAPPGQWAVKDTPSAVKRASMMAVSSWGTGSREGASDSSPPQANARAITLLPVDRDCASPPPSSPAPGPRTRNPPPDRQTGSPRPPGQPPTSRLTIFPGTNPAPLTLRRVLPPAQLRAIHVSAQRAAADALGEGERRAPASAAFLSGRCAVRRP